LQVKQVDDPKERPGTENGYKVQRNITDILEEFEFTRDKIEILNTYIMRWERPDAKAAWHDLTMALWRIEQSALAARARVYRVRRERRRGDTGPLRDS